MTTNHIAFMGDTHSNSSYMEFAIPYLATKSISEIYHVGDFGIWPGPWGKRYIEKVSQLLTEHDMNIFVTLGNHEDYNQVEAAAGTPYDGYYEPFEFAPRVWILPRVYRFKLGDVRLLSLGGAPSVDRSFRKQNGTNRTWWAQEMPTDEQVWQAIQVSDPVDVMITHDAPKNSFIDKLIEGNPHGFFPMDLAYAAEGRERIHHAVTNVMPRVNFHGHYHAYHQTKIIDDIEVFGLGKEWDSKNLAWLNLDNLERGPYDTKYAIEEYRYKGSSFWPKRLDQLKGENEAE